MNSNHQNIAQLLQKSLDGRLSQAELEELIMLAKDGGLDEKFDLHMSAQLAAFRVKEAQEISFWQNQLAEIPGKVTAGLKSAGGDLRSQPPVHRGHLNPPSLTLRRAMKTAWIRYAAILLLIAGTATYLYITSQPSFRRNPGVTNNHVTPVQSDISPGTNRAILTAGNQTINLAANKTGIAINNTITYTDGEKILPASETRLLQLATPRGGQYQAVLPDGTKVWLNAASSIQFPSRFDGVERKVEITGEAYFEVATDKTKPFIVKTTTDEIQVLGTSFNVNAYPEEQAVKTSLLEGSVKIGNTILKPGEAFSNGKKKTTHIQRDVAWKNGVFNFEGLSFQQVMRELARWYDVEIVYENGFPDIGLSGKMKRNLTFGEVLHSLDKVGVHSRLEGHILTIIP